MTQFNVSEENMSGDVFSFCIDSEDIFKPDYNYIGDNVIDGVLTEQGYMLYDVLNNIYGVSLLTFERYLNLIKISIKINLTIISFDFIIDCIGLLFLQGYEQFKYYLHNVRNIRLYNNSSMIVYEYPFLYDMNMRKYNFLKMMTKNKSYMSIWSIQDIIEYTEHNLQNDSLVDYSYLSRYGKLFFNHFVDFIISHAYFQNIFLNIVIYKYSMDISLRQNNNSSDADMFFNEYNESLNRIFDFGVVCRE